jgi:ABC-type uncharacterized transport system involved in gliding motility auxiliary subunit
MRDSGKATRRQLLHGTSLGAGVLLVAALLIIVNYFGWKYYQRFDWTSGRLYSLSDKSRAVVSGLASDVEAVVFMTPSSQLYVPVTELLSRYEAASPRIKVRVLDPERNPAEARRLLEQYDVQSLNSVVLAAADGERRVIEEADLAEYDYSGMQTGQGPQIREFKGEQLITGAILELVEKRKPKILFTTGHGELAPDDVSPRGLSQAQDLLGRDNFEVETWSSLGQAQVPDGTDLVVIAGPQVGLVEPELQTLTRFLIGGGRVLLLLDPVIGAGGIEPTSFGPWLEGYGVRLDDDIVIDPTNPLPFYSAETFFANQYQDHPITEALEDASYPVIFSLARSVGALERDSDASIEVTELVRSSPDAWGETDLSKLDAVAMDDADVPGPVGLGVAVEIAALGAKPAEEEDGSVTVLDEEGEEEVGEGEEEDGEEVDEEVGEAVEVEVEEGSTPAAPAPTAASESDAPPPAAGAVATAGDADSTADSPLATDFAPAAVAPAAPRPGRLVVFGDSDFASNGQLASVGNPTLLLNAMNWLVERENLLAIPAKKADQIQLNLTRRDLSTIYLIVLVGLPLASVSAGVGVYLRRRR